MKVYALRQPLIPYIQQANPRAAVIGRDQAVNCGADDSDVL